MALSAETLAKLAKLGVAGGSAIAVDATNKVEEIRKEERLNIVKTEPLPNQPATLSSNSTNPSLTNLDFAAKLGPQVHEIKEFNAQEFHNKLEALTLAIHQHAPGIPTYLEQINQQLNQYPELVHKLSPEKIGIIVSGCLKMTNTTMAEVITKKKGGGKLSKDQIDSMGF